MFTGQWQNRPTTLDAYKPYLDQRWQEGCTNAWKLWEESKEQGYPRGYAGVRAYVSRNLRGKPQPVGPRPPSARSVTRWFLTHPDALPETDRIQLKAVLANCHELAALSEHVPSFARMEGAGPQERTGTPHHRLAAHLRGTKTFAGSALRQSAAMARWTVSRRSVRRCSCNS